MPASSDEIEQGEDEGITIDAAAHLYARPRGRRQGDGREFLDVDSFYFDEDGVPQIEVVEDSEHMLEADTVIFAVGQRPELPDEFDLDKTDRGLVELDPFTHATSREGVFAAGDAVSGTASAIKAIASGRQAAIAVDKFLGGNGRIDQKLAPSLEPAPTLGPGEGFAALERAPETCLLPQERLSGFCEVVRGMEPEAAGYESARCLQCDLRLKIKAVKFWGNY